MHSCLLFYTISSLLALSGGIFPEVRFDILSSLIAALFSMVLVSAVYVITQQTQSSIYFEDTRVYISSDTFVYI